MDTPRLARILLCSTLLLAACGKSQPQSQPSAPPAPARETPTGVDPTGDLDPIADPRAVAGGSLTSWGGPFPKSLNVWLDNHTISEQISMLQFESLVELHSTKNEPVGVLADSWSISEDKMIFTFHIDPRAKWSDGRPVTAADCQFYYDVIMNPKNLTSLWRVGLKRFDRPEVVDDHTLRLRANEVHWKNFWEAAGLFALPKHVWGNLDFNKQNFEFPVVSGPYEVAELKKDRSLTLKRRADWWGREKRYNQYKYNLESLKFRFMEDRNKVLESFKKGDLDLYAIHTASIWAEKTDFDQVKKGWVVRQRVFNKEPMGYQGFAINLRRPLFQDKRVREALCYLLNRDLMNEKLMHRQYFLLNSYHPDLYLNNVNPDQPARAYDPEKARALLANAGWKVGAAGTLAKDGRKFEVVIPTESTDLRHYNVYIEDLQRVGILAGIDQISESTLTKRIDHHEFDLYWQAWGATRLRDPEAMWHSSTANEIATQNHPGVADKRVDELIEAQKTEMNLDRRNEILRQLDRHLNEIIPYVLMWWPDHHRLLYWNKFGTPTHVLDKFTDHRAAASYWWLDPSKEKALQEAMKSNQPLDALSGDVHYKE